jgi:hypothetical protein
MESKWWYRLLAMFGDRRCRSGSLIQLFDGLGAAVFGVLTPLVVSDIAHDKLAITRPYSASSASPSASARP